MGIFQNISLQTIVYRGAWFWKPANVNVENNGAVVYVGSSLTVHNLLNVLCSQIVTEQINATFLLVVSKFKMIGMLLNVVHGKVQKS